MGLEDLPNKFPSDPAAAVPGPTLRTGLLHKVLRRVWNRKVTYRER